MKNRLKVSIFFLVTIAFLIIPIIKFSSTGLQHGQFLKNDGETHSSRYMLNAEEKPQGLKSLPSERESVKKAQDTGRDESSILLSVMAVVLAVWIGLAVFLIKINLKIVKLEKEINEL